MKFYYFIEATLMQKKRVFRPFSGVFPASQSAMSQRHSTDLITTETILPNWLGSLGRMVQSTLSFERGYIKMFCFDRILVKRSKML
jgi:hypothetical protein